MARRSPRAPRDLELDIRITRGELTILIGSIVEAVDELGDDEFHTRVGLTAVEARDLRMRLVELRNRFDDEYNATHAPR